MNKQFTIQNIANVPQCGPAFSTVLADNGMQLRRTDVGELQVNLGKLCNQACHHCHVDAGPKRTEIMTRQTMEQILGWISSSPVTSVDLTGGAPELNPDFRYLVDHLLALGLDIKSRCNLTVLFEPGQEDLAEWYAEREIQLICSLPCYTRDNVDSQRGNGVFDKSIRGLQRLNKLGYGRRKKLSLDLVYNPGGAFLPPPQYTLEETYHRELKQDFGIDFGNLLTITNIPINRFAHSLRRDGKIESYQQLLVENFNAETVAGLMCRHLISVDWLGQVYDCDFNQMLDLPLGGAERTMLWDLDPVTLEGRGIAVDRHCFGCTAGAGSSCGGALTN
jgi:radical SAM/Cys-rich protein